MKRYAYLFVLMLLASLHIAAQTTAIRYVSKNGAYGNSGESWGQAMNNIQDAINSVAATGGYVFVAKGTYTPTESTESTGGSTLYMSFKIPAGVKVYGGFYGNETGANAEEIIAERDLALTNTELGKFFRDANHETILSGNLSTRCEFNWNNTKELYDPTFYGNTYHVVWFALGTKMVADKEYKGFDADGKAIPLAKEAVLDGFTITGGHAYNNSVTDKEHNAYGGGAYMVQNSTIRNCQFYNCDASRDGGAIYMNGGGKVDKCFIHNCQALGLGVLSGFGGGICMDGGNAQVLHTALVNNVARMGGGLATSYHPEISTDKLGLIVASCVMSNNVATTEGGGAYLDGAGLMTNCTVVRNKCNGSGVTSNGMVTGRAASVYVRDHAHIYNSVLWGGKCAANNDIQYANSRSDINNASLKPELHYVALNEADHVDWSATTKNNVFKLAAYNDQAEATAAGADVASTEGFPMFDNPATSAGHGTETTDPDKWEWHTKALSYLNHKGILINDLTASCGDLPNISDHRSITGDKYITHCTLGAYTSAIPTIVPEDAGSNTYNIYVDPSRNAGTDGSIGASWDAPVLYLGDALYKADELSKAGKTVNIYMKEGVANNTNSYTSDRARDISFTVPNNVHIYGGYPKENTGTSLAGRNPVEHPTVLSANIHGDYDLNVAHLVSFIPGVTNATLDGVEIRYANARSDQMTDHHSATSLDGAAIFLYGATGVKIKNVTVAHCTARNGAGLYAIHNSAVTLENCIFHNNEAKQGVTLGGVIYADAGSTVTMDHCDVIRNVGNAFVSENTTAQTINNSVFYANMRSSQADTNGKAEYAAYTPLTGSFSGSNNIFDEKTQLGTTGLPASLAVATQTIDAKTYGTLSFNRNDEANYPRFVNPTKNAGVSTGGDITYYGRAVSFEPTNLNPMVNAASTGDVAHTSSASWGYDITGVVSRDFGGRPDIGAVENHASDDNKNNQPAYGSVMYVRDYNTYNNDGTVKTTDTNITGRDGSSWATAINGNGTYSSVKGLQYAVNNGTGKEVWVAGGTYTGNFTMVNGVNVLGGFAKTGNPGKNERDISNTKSEYTTVLSANNSGRVLNQAADFGATTMWEGLTLTNGSTTGANYGAGAYLRNNGILKNCLITGNTLTANSSTAANSGGGGLYMAQGSLVKNCKIEKNTLNGNGQGNLFGGAGVCSNGGTLINSLIVENTARNNARNILGAGFYIQQKSSLYNCTIAYNVGNETGSYAATGGVWDGAAAHQGGGVYTNSSLFYNCIIWGNYATGTTAENMVQVGKSGFSSGAGSSNDSFHDCYHSAPNTTRACDDASDPNKTFITGTGDAANTYNAFYNACLANEPFVRIDGVTDYSLKASAAQCINMGASEDVLAANDITEDIMGADRIQDCTVDKGAYEFNGSYAITPTVDGNVASFYVTPNGAGTASAQNPANAACAAKLQKVIDAAGRYKYDNPTKQVIVKVANSASLEAAHNPFKYYATRTTDADDENVRVWSIMIPRGVEVWGGYSDDDNFAARNITDNPTYFDSYYMNKAAQSAVHTYHVVTFTDKVFDENGNVMNDGAPEPTDLSMSARTTDRAIIDGIFITGGQADGEDFGSTDNVNINQYGGAAIVTDYAHVRNCILRDNTATYGGALALTHGALVSGSLFLENEANHGGALYVFEDATNLSDGTTIATKNTGAGAIDQYMPHVYTSTIVNNNATQQGGGVWFGNSDANVRFNSCVLWQNDSPDQANVAGVIAPNGGDNTQTVQVYPFAYTAVQNQRMPGTNNIIIATQNQNGARFDFTTDPYYGLQDYSALLQNGMPITEYTSLKDSKKLAAYDYAGIDRLISTDNSRAYIEIGARALDHSQSFNPDKLLLRLFVSEPQYVDMDAAQTMMDSGDSYYSQEGSSFAYPFQKLDQALDYIIKARKELQGKANNLPFEIFIGKGEYHPSRDLAGNYGYSLANTFLVPEGVSIYGGFDPKGGGDFNFLGQYWVPKYDSGGNITVSTAPASNGYFFVANNTNNVKAKVDGNVVHGYNFSQIGLKEAIALRDIADINANNIIEPWEFKNQTVLSGAATNMSSEGVYHVITIVADEKLVGTLPKASITHNAAAAAADPTLFDYTQQTYGSYDYEEGQTVTLNGLMVTGGRAYGYTNNSLDEWGEYSYYHGGGVLVDGNRYCDWFNKHDGDLETGNGIEIRGAGDYVVTTSKTAQYLHTGVSQAVGFRDIPVSIESCKFVDNVAGYGGAVNSNGTIDLFNCSLEQNKAMSGEDQNLNGTGKNVQYPGNGGAVYGTHQISMFNTLLANNEAYDKGMIESATSAENPGPQPRTFQTFRNQTPTTEILGGCGGAFFGGQFSHFHIVNTDFVRNQACVYPAAFTMNPNQDFQKVLSANHPTYGVPQHAVLMTPMYNQFTNTVFWGNDIHPDMKAWDNYEVFKTNSRLICNYGSATRANAYNCRWNAKDNAGTIDAHPQTLADLDDDSKFGETAWFCAYEQKTGIKQNNLKDYRDLDYSPIGYAKTQIMSYGVDYQNCNIVIASDNFDLDGPNFVSPSMKPGIEGYTESADWSPARLNKLTDQGSGKIQQTISIVGDTYQSTFDTYTDDSQVPDVRKAYSNETTGDFITSGAYTMTRYLDNYPKYNENLMLGEERYMESATTTQKLWRISYDPNPTHNQTYIDIGVYEYPHTELHWTSEGDEVDILWVSPIEKPENGLPEGSAWTQPTSDLQRAIETLLASRNGHRKEIRLMDGQFTPIYTIEDNLSFYFNTEYVNQSVMMPENWEQESNKERFSIKSFTIKGGYSRDQNNMYDVDQFPAIIRGQQRTDGTGTQWNHAFYIKDAVQRYGNEVSDANAQGAFALFSLGEEPVATTIPIEFYGVTFVNDQALSNTQGAALCYEDQKVVYTGSKFEAKTYEAEAPKTANLREITYYTDDTYTTPSPNNAPTEYVKYQEITDPQTPVVLDKNATSTPTYTPAKLVLANCRVMASGTHYDGAHQNDKTSSAVFIGKGGGSALLYNDLMHSNYGNPLVSMCNTEIINNTIALNAGLVDLGGEITLDQDGEGAQGGIQLIGPRRNAGAIESPTSKIFNTVLWKNNVKSTDPSAPLYGQQFSLPGYVSDAASGSIFARNAYTYNTGTGEDDVTQATDYVTLGNDLSGLNYNVHLANTNADLIYGPNFIDPENADIESRNFKLTPSLRLLNKGDNDYYNASLPAHDDTDAEHWKFNIYDYAWEALPAIDAGSAQRVMFTNIDLGAFEYQNSLNRVVYVNPNTMYSPGQDGMGWATALGGNSIQTAIDLAGLYHINNDQHEAYVLVKGNVYPTNKDNETGETLTLRDGVSVIGSIDPEYVTDIPYTTNIDGSINFAPEDLTNGLAEIINLRKGLAAPNANRTIISGVRTNDNTRYNANDNTFAGIDGFEIHGGDVTEPVINVNPIASSDSKAVMGLRNIIVRDTKVTGTNTNVANVGNALLYEVLMRDNTPGDGGAVLNLTDGGYLVSGTIEGTTKETTGVNVAYPTSTGSNARTFNSLVNYGGEAWITNTLSGYSYHMANKNQNYQLTEGSKNIDVCATTLPTVFTGVNAASHLASFIDYSTDRDLLGNPRLLKLNGEETNTLDRGAFETWKIAQDVVATSNTNATYNGWTGTHYYPHDGSVVYIMEGKSLNSGVDLHPGYLLLQNGANLFGGGHKVDANYLAVERNVSKTGALLSLPYDMNYATGAQYPSYAADEAANKGELTLTAVDHAKAQAYNGLMRSEPNYELLDSESPCWSDIASDATANASEGVLFTYTPEGTADANLIRFTGNSGDFETPIYTENGDSKVVELTQYNSGGRDTNKNGNTGDDVDFTDAEDMGWNAIGLPYLVSDYNPAATENFTGNSLYNMHIPHELWLYYDGTVSLDGNESKNGANFYPVNSWEHSDDLSIENPWHVSDANQQAIWVGEGFFLQTATLDDTEALTFHRPVYDAPSPIVGKRLYLTTEVDQIADNGAYIVSTRYYAPNGIQLAKPVRGVNIAVDIYSDGSKRTRKIQK